MSTPTLQQTRQQLDDLDGLIQRMLTLPLTHLEDSQAKVTAEALRMPPEEFAPLPFPNRRMMAEARITPTETVAHTGGAVQGWRVEFGSTNQRLTTLPLPGEIVEEQMLPYANVVAEEVARPVLPAPRPQHSPREPLSPIAWPLYLTTRTFDLVLGWGPFAGLTKPTGKTLLGLAGLAMLVAAVVWAYYDWTEFRWTDSDISPSITSSK